MLFFVVPVFLALWLFIHLNNRAGRLTETLRVWPNQIAVERHELNGEIKRWQTNPYWMRMNILPEGGPVDNYLTLKGADREIELGAFLSPDERIALHNDISAAIRDLGQHYA